MLIQRSAPFIDGANCVPPGVNLLADIDGGNLSADAGREGLPNGSIVRFHYRGDSVVVFLYPRVVEGSVLTCISLASKRDDINAFGRDG